MIALHVVQAAALDTLGLLQSALEDSPAIVTAEQAELLGDIQRDLSAVTAKVEALAQKVGIESVEPVSRLSVFHGYIPILVVAFFVTLIATPIMRRLAVKHGEIDRPNETRKIHKQHAHRTACRTGFPFRFVTLNLFQHPFRRPRRISS